MPDPRLERAFAAIDAANADDPNTIVVDGRRRPKEQAHAELMTRWVEALDPDPSDAQLLAARAHHVRRWTVPRSDFPEGRAGYLRWRTRLGRLHAELAAEIVADVGYPTDVTERVGEIITKKRLATDPQVQTHEDALCLVFLETQFADVASRLGPDKTVDVVAKTIAKMSPRGIEIAGGLVFGDDEAELLARALAKVARD
jgi:hypothetical protein